MVFINQEDDNEGFCFLIDTTVNDNYLDKQYMEYYHIYFERILSDNPFDIYLK